LTRNISITGGLNSKVHYTFVAENYKIYNSVYKMSYPRVSERLYLPFSKMATKLFTLK